MPFRRYGPLVSCWLLATLALLLLTGCWQRESGQPARVVWDRDMGEHCGMIISDRRFAAQAIEPNGKAHKFDDIGCMLAWLEDKPFRGTARLWVRDSAGQAWLDARTTRFRHGVVSPMGYGFIAVDSPETGDVDFAGLEAAVLAEQRRRLDSPTPTPHNATSALNTTGKVTHAHD